MPRGRPALLAFVTVLAVLVAAPAASAACTQGAAAVDASFRTALSAIREDRTAPPRAARALAAVAVAMDEALEAADRAGRCAHAATAARAAARPVIAELLWATSVADRERARRLTGPGARLGARAARRTLARIARDKLNPDEAIALRTGPELWEPAPPDFMGPTDVSATTWRPWNLRDVKALRPPKPPTGTALTAQTLEVWRAVRQITPEQRANAVLWADGAGTVTPPGHWTEIALDVLKGRGGGRLARAMATVETAQADAFIACWDAKYAYWLVRPVTMIQRFDPSWAPVLPTPPFPAYVSGHASTSAAAATVLGALVPARRAEVERLAAQAAQSRVDAGIHFPVDSSEGTRLGRRVARIALRRRAGPGSGAGSRRTA